MGQLLFFNYDKIKLQTFQLFFPHQDVAQVYNQFLQNALLQTLNETDPSYAHFLHQSSSVCQIISHQKTLKNTIVSNSNRFPQKDPVSHKQKDLNLLTVTFARSWTSLALLTIQTPHNF